MTPCDATPESGLAPDVVSVEVDAASCEPALHQMAGFNASGSKYLREVRCLVDGRADVYAVLEAFSVSCPARQHAIKKLLCAGIRGKGDAMQDLREARDAVDRAIQMEGCRVVP